MPVLGHLPISSSSSSSSSSDDDTDDESVLQYYDSSLMLSNKPLAVSPPSIQSVVYNYETYKTINFVNQDPSGRECNICYKFFNNNTLLDSLCKCSVCVSEVCVECLPQITDNKCPSCRNELQITCDYNRLPNEPFEAFTDIETTAKPVREFKILLENFKYSTFTPNLVKYTTNQHLFILELKQYLRSNNIDMVNSYFRIRACDVDSGSYSKWYPLHTYLNAYLNCYDYDDDNNGYKIRLDADVNTLVKRIKNNIDLQDHIRVCCKYDYDSDEIEKIDKDYRRKLNKKICDWNSAEKEFKWKRDSLKDIVDEFKGVVTAAGNRNTRFISWNGSTHTQQLLPFKIGNKDRHYKRIARYNREYRTSWYVNNKVDKSRIRFFIELMFVFRLEISFNRMVGNIGFVEWCKFQIALLYPQKDQEVNDSRLYRHNEVFQGKAYYPCNSSYFNRALPSAGNNTYKPLQTSNTDDFDLKSILKYRHTMNNTILGLYDFIDASPPSVISNSKRYNYDLMSFVFSHTQTYYDNSPLVNPDKIKWFRTLNKRTNNSFINQMNNCCMNNIDCAVNNKKYFEDIHLDDTWECDQQDNDYISLNPSPYEIYHRQPPQDEPFNDIC
tara:strand:+ start:10635 stop:12467 length:1833 start_codon:yes stop_codon:yes gene_type:complete